MSKEISEKVRPIYEELKGYLEEFPPFGQDAYPTNSFYWTSIDECVKRLNDITGDDYDRFRLTVLYDRAGQHITNHEYRGKVNGLIKALKGRYFNEEDIAGNPLIAVNQTQNVQITMLLEVSTMIDKQLFGESAKNLKPEEKSFLQKVKDQLPTIKTAAELLTLVVKTATENGLDIHTVAKALGLA